MLGSIDIVAFVPTKDTEKARAFYEGVLGLRFLKDDGFALVLDANGIMVRVAKAPQFMPAPFTILGWQVTDIEKIVAALQAKGVQFEVRILRARCARDLDRAYRRQGGVVQGSRREYFVGVTARLKHWVIWRFGDLAI